MQNISDIITSIQPLVDAVHHHKTFESITSVERLRRFSEIHVYAVWDFMALLKGLQRKIACMDPLWHPPMDYLGCRLVNDMIAEEESDVSFDNCYLSHFDMYLAAMQQCGANTQAILAFMADVKQKLPLEVILAQPYVPDAAKKFITATFQVIGQKTHAVAASLAFARENITAGMFGAILQRIHNEQPSQPIDRFTYYFQRHIDLDSGVHSDKSQQLVSNLCGKDPAKWQDAATTAVFSLRSRIQLLDDIYQHLVSD